MSVRTYDPQDVNVVVNGIFLTGFAEGTMVTIEKAEDRYNSYVGAKGEVSRARNANEMGTITVRLKSDSPSNIALTNLEKGNELLSVFVVDQNFGTTSGGNDSWIQKQPNIEYGNEITEREWVFQIPKLVVDE